MNSGRPSIGPSERPWLRLLVTLPKQDKVARVPAKGASAGEALFVVAQRKGSKRSPFVIVRSSCSEKCTDLMFCY